MGFSNSFLKWLLSYLGEQRQFLQKDAKKSDFAVVEFGMPQGSILGPSIFNLYVADLQDSLQCPCYQYADDTMFFLHSKVSELDACTAKLNCAISRLEGYSADSNLAINASKTKLMLTSTAQMSGLHNLDNLKLNVNCQGEPLERVQSTRLLGVLFDEHLTWNEHITKLLASCYMGHYLC